ncbi:MAG: hypothetical protein RIC06_13920 [Cyclobacteriaceae bacterium]
MTNSTLSGVNKVQVILKFTYGLVPIVAGLDKFTNLLTNWAAYVPESIAGILPITPSALMMVVGVIEMAAGVIVLRKTALGAYIVAAWLILIALNLLILGSFDIAVRDIVMAIGAFSLAKITEATAGKVSVA